MQGHQCQEAEVSWFGSQISRLIFLAGGRLEEVPRLEEVLCKVFGGEELIVDLNSFTDEAQMRGSIKPDLLE